MLDGRLDKPNRPHKRFEISHDEYSRDRLEKLKELREELKELLPGVNIGISLFGSLSKGKELYGSSIWKLRLGNAHKSDVDFICFFDSDDLAKQHAELLRTNQDYAHMYLGEVKKNEKIADLFEQDKLERSARDEAAQLVIDSLISKRLGSLVTMQYTTRSISMGGDDSILKQTFAEIEPLANEALARFFHLDVGGGLKQYRQDFLQKLVQRPDGEEIWRVCDQSVRAMERYREGGKVEPEIDSQFPRTLAEAIKYYGLPKQDTAEAL